MILKNIYNLFSTSTNFLNEIFKYKRIKDGS